MYIYIVYRKTFFLILCVYNYIKQVLNYRKSFELIFLYISLIYLFILFFFFFIGMGKEVENLIMENNELLATK